ncbi:MAG: AAA family ATPase [Bradyrhizobium sp.]|uniref:AAA family ATPase n=1 Tax=Bradyrhizobium sp. TaxID=376 RepID=UPI001DF03052|nr:AAA family ATPase [Bradyrhizobium sp.]MBV9566043.1 AAA family ATPase [Bradyrhizobium sp.]
MLQIHKPQPRPDAPASTSEAESLAQLYASILGFLRRRLSIIAFALGCFVILAVVYIKLTPPTFAGHAVLIMDSHKTQFFQQQQPLGDLPIDSPTVDTQIEILNSENIALSVVKRLHLDQDPEFIYPSSGVIGGILGFLKNLNPFRGSDGVTASAVSDDSWHSRTAMGTVLGHLAVKRIGFTYAISIDYQSLNPDRAAQVANAVADAYFDDVLEAKYETTRRAAGWLQDRLKELREQSQTADRAVVDFKTKHNIVNVDNNGRLLNEQQIGELNTALVQARAQTAEAQARLQRVQQILASDDPDPASSAAATVTDTLHNEVITRLRQQYLELGAKEADWTARYGRNHLAVVNLRNQRHEIRLSILDELRRIAETYKSEFEIAKARQDSVQKSLDDIVAKSQTMNEAQVTLHNLDSSSQSYRSLYDNFLQKYMESVQQQSFPITEARLITQATPPLGKSGPKSTQILILAALVGLTFGLGIGLLREIADRVFRTTAQIHERLHAECIALLPLIKGEIKSVSRERPKRAETAAVPRVIARKQDLFWIMADSPFSRFAESIRSIKVAADLNRGTKLNNVVAITSSLPNEGKSTIAMALAQHVALGGGKAVLVDCDLRNPSLTRKLAPRATKGFLEVIWGKLPLSEVLWKDPATNLAFVPTVVRGRLADSSNILSSDQTQKLFEKLRAAYDYIIVDLSPLAPVVDVRAMTHLVDSFVFVVEWGRTNIEIAEHVLSGAPGVYENLLGVVLNKVNMKVFARYESSRESYYYNRHFARYGYTD